MSNVRLLKSERAAPAVADDDYLGPAVVVEAEGDEVAVRMPRGAVVRAEMALAFPYKPAPEDVVLVIARGEQRYVIGVLRGSGKTTLAFEGDVDLRAVGGKLALHGDAGVEVRGREVEILTDAVRVVAGSMVEKLGSAYRRVTGLFSVRAGDAQTIVDGTSTTKARDGVILTEEKMTINGKQIYLG